MGMPVESHNGLAESDFESHNDNAIVEKVWPKQTWSIDQLEVALKRRIGWVDEAISPFARRTQQADHTAGETAAAR